jgi:hypothetical protein
MKRCIQELVTAVALAMAITTTTAAGAAPSPGAVDRFERLLGLARIWAEVKYFHPAMFQRAVDWDGALIRALPEVEAASDAASYRTAIGHLLAAIGDPRTAVEATAVEDAVPATTASRVGDGVLVVDARMSFSMSDVGAMRRMGKDARAAIAGARVVVIDLRGRDDDDDRLFEQVIESLPATGEADEGAEHR